MEFITTWLLPLLYAFGASAGFAIVYNIHGVGILICALGGSLGWLAYLLSAPILQSDISQMFVAAIVISIYSEVMARVRKCPATGYLLVAFFPLVPGGSIYYTMKHAIQGEIDLFLAQLLHTLGLAGAIAVGVMLVSSTVRMWRNLHIGRKERRL